MLDDLIGSILSGLGSPKAPPEEIRTWSGPRRFWYVAVRGLLPLVLVFAVIALAAVCAGPA